MEGSLSAGVAAAARSSSVSVVAGGGRAAISAAGWFCQCYLTITKIIPMILQQDMKSDNNIMPMLSKYLLLFLVPYDNMLIIITGKNSSRVPFQTGLS